MLAKNQINRNKTDNRTKTNKKNIDFILFIQVISMDISSSSKQNPINIYFCNR